MTARIAGFVTRAEAGLRKPTSISKNITPERGGCGVHYGGPFQPAADPGSDHAKCISTWRAWQNYHMGTHGWSDLAYTGGFCNHGYAFAGRGAGVRTAANGTNAGNQNYYAITWIGGEGQTPTQEALDAADWWLVTLRAAGAGRSVKPHRWFKATGCPGDPLVGYAASRDGVADLGGSAPAPGPTPPNVQEDDMSKIGPGSNKNMVMLLQNTLIKWAAKNGKPNPLPRFGADGDYGNETKAAVAAVQSGRLIDVREPGIADGGTLAYLALSLQS